ncbi:hypothetical protein BGX26_001437 [Mortierella sp. AD094]|nr:hypothetical protein BGX26_001437 [Mortierella sp. AD094]
MKLFKLDFGIKDRYRRGLAQGARVTRSPQTESSASFNEHSHEHDPHHQATSPSSPSVLFSAGVPSLKTQNEPMEQWSQFGSSLEASFSTEVQSNQNNQLVEGYAVTMAHPLTRSGGGGRHLAQEYDNGDEYEIEHSNDGYLSSASSSSVSSGGSLSSTSSLSPSSSSYSSDESDSSDDDDYSDDDEDMEGQSGADDADNHNNTLDIDSSGFSYNQKLQYDYYRGSRLDVVNEHGGMLPPAPLPAIEPISNRDALEQEARQRRLERHIDKRRQSLNGNQPAPTPRRKKRKKAKDLRKQVLLKNAQQLLD